MKQGTKEWHDIRCGRITASRIGDIMKKLKSGGYGAGHRNYVAELVAERLTGEPADSFTNAAMQWGTDTEPQARSAYEFEKDVEVEEIGFVKHPDIEMAGCSPDGLVGDDGLVEIKCPKTATHIDTLRGSKIKKSYLLQMQWQMACTGRKWCDWVSYDPRMPLELSLFIKRVKRSDKKIKEMESEVRAADKEVDSIIEELKEKK